MKNTISLDGTWQLAGFDEGAADWSAADVLLPDGATVVDARVPGEVHPALFAAGVIPDPYFGVNGDDLQWIETREWWYRREFEVGEDFIGGRTYLEFDSLDTYATVYLNGEQVGRSENMFVPVRFDVTGRVGLGTNTVAVRFEPAAPLLDRMDHSHLSGCFDTPRANSRKMQCAFGWDWTQRFVGAGICGDARLVSYGTVSIADVHIDVELTGATASAWINIEVDNYSREDKHVMASVVVCRGECREHIEVVEDISPFGGVIEAVVRIEEPEFWWPNGAGEQPMYKCLVGLQSEGEVEDVAEQSFAIRTVELREALPDGSRCFTLVVNGEPIFCKGANWVPADHFVSNMTEERYRELVKLAKDAGFNMLRVWGGGIYETEAFYAACDEMGVMIWQDFMFACAIYPEDEGFRQNVGAEVRAVVKRLRNHPSIVVWCGNNECEMGHSPSEEWQGKVLFHEVIPAALAQLDRSRPYRFSTPYGGSFGNDDTVGTWHGGSWFDTYLGDEKRWRHLIEEKKSLFCAEFYAQGSPEMESVKLFVPQESLWPPDGPIWEYHNKDNPHSGRTDGLSHQQILIDMTRRMMGGFSTPEEFAAYSGILQGEFVAAEFERWRRDKWKSSGAIFWMYDDAWPAVGWSLVDYFGRPKPAYYHAKRACAPVILSFKQLDGRAALYVTSDEIGPDVDCVVQVGALSFGSCGISAEEVDIRVIANASQAIWESEEIEDIFEDPRRQCLVAFLISDAQMVAKAVYFPRLFCEMEFPQPKLLVERSQTDEFTHEMTFSADDYARSVCISNLPAAARPSDNYFDLVPGEMHAVTIERLTATEAKALKVNVWRR